MKVLIIFFFLLNFVKSSQSYKENDQPAMSIFYNIEQMFYRLSQTNELHDNNFEHFIWKSVYIAQSLQCKDGARQIIQKNIQYFINDTQFIFLKYGKYGQYEEIKPYLTIINQRCNNLERKTEYLTDMLYKPINLKRFLINGYVKLFFKDSIRSLVVAESFYYKFKTRYGRNHLLQNGIVSDTTIQYLQKYCKSLIKLECFIDSMLKFQLNLENKSNIEIFNFLFGILTNHFRLLKQIGFNGKELENNFILLQQFNEKKAPKLVKRVIEESSNSSLLTDDQILNSPDIPLFVTDSWLVCVYMFVPYSLKYIKLFKGLCAKYFQLRCFFTAPFITLQMTFLLLFFWDDYIRYISGTDAALKGKFKPG